MKGKKERDWFKNGMPCPKHAYISTLLSSSMTSLAFIHPTMASIGPVRDVLHLESLKLHTMCVDSWKGARVRDKRVMIRGMEHVLS